MRQLLLSAALLGACTLSTSLVWGEPPRAPRLTWTRAAEAESCVSAEELQRMLARVVGDAPTDSPLGDARIEGVVSRGKKPDTWRARLRIVAPDGSALGQRELATRQPLCSALTPSVLLVLLVLLEPDAAERGLPTEVVQAITQQADAEAQAQTQEQIAAAPAQLAPPPVLPSAPAATNPVRRQVSTAPATRVGAGLRWRMHLEPIVSFGLLPSAVLGLSGGIGLVTRDGWQMSFVAGYGGSNQLALEPNSYVAGGHVVASALVFDLSVCPELAARARWGLNGCAGATLVRRSFETPALSVHTDPVRLSLGPSLGGQWRIALTELWHVLLRASTAMPLPRERFVYEDGDGDGTTHHVYTPGRVFASLALGLGAEL